MTRPVRRATRAEGIVFGLVIFPLPVLAGLLFGAREVAAALLVGGIGLVVAAVAGVVLWNRRSKA